jgi:ribosomal protein S18 acetylase RimI-like enzyme
MQKLDDPAALEPILNQDWPWAGFAIGDLEPELMRLCQWWRCKGSTVLLFDGLSPRLMSAYGDPSGFAEILAEIQEPRLWVNIRPEFAEILGRFYRTDGCVRMRRMWLDRPVEAVGSAVPLSADDRADVEELLRQGEWVLFLPERLDGGHYFGVRDGNGRLVAIAGTHVTSVRYNIGALGSVFTHPDHRGRGLARICCTHTLASLGQAGIRRVVLNVEESKAGARQLYEQLGFRTACLYLDGSCTRSC